MTTERFAPRVLLIILMILALSTNAMSQVTVVRGGHENPMVTIGKSTLYGAGTGLLIGLALSLALESDSEEIFRWSFVGGTVAGFAVGVMHVARRPQPQSAALLQFDSKGLAKVTVPEPQVRFTRNKKLDFKVNLVSLSL